MDLRAAVEAIETNSADATIAAYKAGGHSVKVSNGKLGGASVAPLAWVEGDTALHLALRNKKWNVRRALVADVGADSMIVNSQGETAPGMHLRDASWRGAIIASAAAVVFFDFLEFEAVLLKYGFASMWLLKLLLGLLGAAAAFDNLLALRWYWNAWSSSYITNHPRTKMLEKKAERKAAKEAAAAKRK